MFRVPARSGTPCLITSIPGGRARFGACVAASSSGRPPLSLLDANGWQRSLRRPCGLHRHRGFTPRQLLDSESHAIDAAPGVVLFTRDGSLMQQPFDLDSTPVDGRALAGGRAGLPQRRHRAWRLHRVGQRSAWCNRARRSSHEPVRVGRSHRPAGGDRRRARRLSHTCAVAGWHPAGIYRHERPEPVDPRISPQDALALHLDARHGDLPGVVARWPANRLSRRCRRRWGRPEGRPGRNGQSACC